MNALTRLAVNRPVTTIMAFLVILVIGITSYTRLAVDLFPEIDPPVISVITTYPGANASDVEINVTEVLEDNFSTINGLDELSSNSADNLSTITLEFTYDIDMNEAANDIRDAMDLARNNLPDDADDPVLFKFDTGMIPVVILGVTADEHYTELDDLLEDRLVPGINRIQGTGAVQVLGSPERQIRIDLDPNRLEAFDLTSGDIRNAVQANNMNMPAGNIKMGRTDYNFRFLGEVESPEQFGNIIVNQHEGEIVYLSDVAEVYDGIREQNHLERINQQRGVSVMVQRQDDANTIEIARQINELLPEIEAQLPPDVEITTIVDTSVFIENSVNNLTQVLLFAGIFIILVVLFFLRRLKSTFIIILTVPFSLIVALIYLYISGNSLNIISLSSLAIAMGMVVDDAIVILENITSHTEKGSRPREAAIYGTNEVGLAVVATTLTVVAVFLPLTFITGMAGVMFGQLGIIVTLTVITSTIAALTLTPMLSAKLLSNTPAMKKGGFLAKVDNVFESVFTAWENWYKSSLSFALNHKVFTIIMAVLIFGGSLLLIPSIGTEYMPESDNAQISMTAELESGRRIEESTEVADKIEAIILGDYGDKVQTINTSIGIEEGGLNIGGGPAGPNIIEFNMSLTRMEERDKSIFEIGEELREKVYALPDIIHLNVEAGEGGGGGNQGQPVQVQILGQDRELASSVADSVYEIVEKTPGTRDVNNSLGAERPQLRFEFDRDKMSASGLNVSTVSSSVRSVMAGETISLYRDRGNEYDVFMRFKPEYRTSISQIENIQVKNPMGDPVRLADIGNIHEEVAPLSIQRVDRQRAVTISSNLFERNLGDVSDDIREEVEKLDLPPGISINYAGDIQSQEEEFRDLGMLLVLSIFLVFAVMASQFESFRDPFIVMFAIPFGFSGVLAALFIFNASLGIISFLGVIILVGIVAKNAIVMVDYTNLMLERGMELREAIIFSGGNRLRPVLMTTFTTVLAMLPLVIGIGEGSEIWRPMGIAVSGGLIVSTAVTLILVPVIYSLMKKNKKS